jgi:DNA topoisomerase-1
MKVKRVGTYKTGFKYYKKNIEIINENELNKLKTFKIPPAYDNVFIINSDKIIAYGYDSKKRKQVIYQDKYIEKQNTKKYEKIKKLIKGFSKLKKHIKKDINDDNQKKAIISMIITIILTCGFRIGNKKYERDNNSFGITTLKFSHVNIIDKYIEIDFIGKKGVQNKAICKNNIIFDFISKNKKISQNDDYIFRYDNNKKCVSSNDVNEYLSDIFKNKKDPSFKVTTKDLRTWNANTLFMKFFSQLKKQQNKNPIKKAIELTADKLHNSYAICKKSYIDPNVIILAERELIEK